MATNDAFNDLPRLTPEGAKGMGKLILNKGKSGTGKSTLALKFPKPICVAYADKDVETVGDVLIDQPTGVDIILIRNWEDYANVFVPAAKNRKINARTIVVDTIDFVGTLGANSIRGSKNQLSIPDWGTFFNRMWSTTQNLVDAAAPHGDHPGYHIIFNSHLKPITTDEGATLLGYECGIPGRAFPPVIEGMFDYVLLHTVNTMKTINDTTNNISGSVRQFKIYSAPPDKYHTCKGGKLPPEIVVPDGKDAFELCNQYWKVKE